jgi:uncharacterized protein
VSQLIAAGAEVNAVSPLGATPLMGAASRGHKDIVNYLLDHGADSSTRLGFGASALAGAAAGGHVDVVSVLLDRGSQGLDAALALASRNGHEQIVQRLLDDGADPTVRDAGGLSPIDWAIKKRHHQILSLLTKRAVTRR